MAEQSSSTGARLAPRSPVRLPSRRAPRRSPALPTSPDLRAVSGSGGARPPEASDTPPRPPGGLEHDWPRSMTRVSLWVALTPATRSPPARSGPSGAAQKGQAPARPHDVMRGPA
ncbi:hypothetical protein WY02_18690 [Pseudonocardia sp. AL041005-10]|nr:hypothetical protein WY02_18690 [Pseudonocardia sp. AL041005-10]